MHDLALVAESLSRAAEIRRRVDVDFLDERLIREGFLSRYHALIFCWGNTLEQDVLARMDEWLRSGGTIIAPSFPRGMYETVDGNSSIFAAWSAGDTGKGSFYRFKGDMEPLELYGDYVEEILRATPSLHDWTCKTMDIVHPPRVFFSVLEDGRLVALNYNENPSKISLKGEWEAELPPFSVSSFKIKFFSGHLIDHTQ